MDTSMGSEGTLTKCQKMKSRISLPESEGMKVNSTELSIHVSSFLSIVGLSNEREREKKDVNACTSHLSLLFSFFCWRCKRSGRIRREDWKPTTE